MSEGDCNAGVRDGEVLLWCMHEYVGGTRGSGFVSNAADMLRMSMMRGMRGAAGVCKMCMCLARAV